MRRTRTRNEAIKLAVYSIRSIYESVRDGVLSSYYGKKLASHYWEKLNLSEKEIFRIFGSVPEIEMKAHNKKSSNLDWLLGSRKEECLFALKYFGFIGNAKTAPLQKKAKYQTKNNRLSSI